MPSLTFPQTLIKQSLVERAMVTLDKHDPTLNNEQVTQAFGLFLNEQSIYQDYHLHEVAHGKVFGPSTLITSDQLQLTYIYEARTAIRRFLKATYRQSWQLDDDCLPYLPAHSLSGGHIISSKDALQNLLGLSPYPGISWLEVDIVGYAFANPGQIFPCRGRGPVWKNNSCALDCAIVAARLLNLGRTVADRENILGTDWETALPPLVRHFIKLVAQPWEELDDKTSYGYREIFLIDFLKEYNTTNNNPTRIGDYLPATAVWLLSTSGIKQKCFSTCQNWSGCSKCTVADVPPTHTPVTHTDVPLIQMNDAWKAKLGERPSMSALLNQFFEHTIKDCRRCKSQPPGTRTTWKAVTGKLPPRLTVLPDRTYRDVVEATSSSIEIQFLDEKGTAHLVTYRWLGGIYQLDGHFRLYWNDCGPNEDDGKVMVYDGLKLEGLIIGRVIPGRLDSKVPPEWCQGTDILFYERVEPSTEALQHAAEAIKREVDHVLQEQLQLWQPAPRNPAQGQHVQPHALQPVQQVNKRKRAKKEQLTSNKVQKT